ncbi:hypothetical protein [Muriicola soli]|uniref:SGNH/GDSL hydrolase family protein n=1 Tax=Muriicola soli TaxID=2507538 RepID=A0A411E844_9FLAO|nr:hypothetical protein [Muriicola soli]QBA63891.1 hypothetical protein EQY75_04665 [Muriicola soli]
MRRFIIKAILFLILVVSIVTITLVQYGGYVDYFYEKFTTPKAPSLILGDSRSFQGIQPKIINKYFTDSDLDLPIFNYSFTLFEISYGKPYLESVKRKLNSKAKNGIFIISVHPWSVSNRSGNHEEERGVYFESDLPPHNMKWVDVSPNFEYLLKNFNYFHFKGMFRKMTLTHKDGWLQDNNLPTDQNILNEWKQIQIERYKRHSLKWVKSNVRMEDLKKTASFLKNHGRVYLVRLPIDEEINKIELKYWHNFDQEMKELSDSLQIDYINFSSSVKKYDTYDGIHIDQYSGVDFTKSLCDSIIKSIDPSKSILD